MLLRFFCVFSFVLSVTMADQPRQWQIWYQESVTPVMDKINSFHLQLLVVTSSILLLVIILLIIVIWRFKAKNSPNPSKTSHNTLLEIIWTLVPVGIIGLILVPSIELIFYMDKIPKADITLKAIGHQWYWEYDYPDQKINFDSYIIPQEKLKQGELRNLEVDKRVVLPINTNVRILTTAADVIHSWFVPAFGVKQDSIPGRLRETWIRINKLGVYYGQCAELCGPGHGFMPIVVQAVTPQEFQTWLQQEQGNLAIDNKQRVNNDNKFSTP